MDLRHSFTLATVAGSMYVAGAHFFTTTSNESPSEDPSVPLDEVAVQVIAHCVMYRQIGKMLASDFLLPK